MKVEKYTYPKSSFLSVEKDTQTIVNKMLENERLKKLLYYSAPDVLIDKEKYPNLTDIQTRDLLKDQVRTIETEKGVLEVPIPPLITFVPKVYVDEVAISYIIITFDNFLPSQNPEFRDCTVQFDIICHYDLWKMADMQSRPYKIAAEIDSMFDNTKLSGIGTLQFAGATAIAISGKEFAGLTLMYTATHGNEDKHWFDYETTPDADEDNIINFTQFLNALK